MKRMALLLIGMLIAVSAGLAAAASPVDSPPTIYEAATAPDVAQAEVTAGIMLVSTCDVAFEVADGAAADLKSELTPAVLTRHVDTKTADAPAGGAALRGLLST